MLPPPLWSRHLQSFYCYIHRLGVMQPELQVVHSRDRDALPDVLLAAMRRWAAFDVVDVYDGDNEQVLCVATDGHEFRN
jgi:hypothetical protein